MFGFLPGASLCCSRAAATYRAHFCGLCNELRRDYGLWARWLINRDSTFLALLASSLSSSKVETCLTTCCNPYGQPRALVGSSLTMHYAAAVTVCGLVTKLEDDAQDEGGLRRWVSAMGARALSEPQATAMGVLHGMEFPVSGVMNALKGRQVIEGARGDLTQAAESTSFAFGEIVAFAARVGHEAPRQVMEALRQIGRALGLLVYAKDALDDWESDRRKNRFNPLIGYLTVAGREEAAAPVILQALAQLQEAFGKLPLQRNRDLLTSILVEGATQRAQEMLSHGDHDFPQRTVIERAPDSSSRRTKPWCDCSFCDCCGCPGKTRTGGNACCDCNPCDGDCGCCGCDCDCG